MTTPKTATVTLSDYPFVLVELVKLSVGYRLEITSGNGVPSAHYAGALLRLAANRLPTEPAE